METKLTKMFGNKYPIMLAAMNMVSHKELVLAVSEAGGLGTFATIDLDPEELEE